jgi:hypothetical protein
VLGDYSSMLHHKKPRQINVLPNIEGVKKVIEIVDINFNMAMHLRTKKKEAIDVAVE